MTKDAIGYLVLEILLSPTYGVDGRSRMPMGPSLRKFT